LCYACLGYETPTTTAARSNEAEMYTRPRHPRRLEATANSPTDPVAAADNDGYEPPIIPATYNTARPRPAGDYDGYEMPIPSEQAPLPPRVRLRPYQNIASV